MTLWDSYRRAAATSNRPVSSRALCADGPKVLEVSAFGDIDLSQHAYRRGFLDAEFPSLLRERGLETLFHGPTNRRARSPTNNRLGARKHHRYR